MIYHSITYLQWQICIYDTGRLLGIRKKICLMTTPESSSSRILCGPVSAFSVTWKTRRSWERPSRGTRGSKWGPTLCSTSRTSPGMCSLLAATQVIGPKWPQTKWYARKDIIFVAKFSDGISCGAIEVVKSDPCCPAMWWTFLTKIWLLCSHIFRTYKHIL